MKILYVGSLDPYGTSHACALGASGDSLVFERDCGQPSKGRDA